jgi:hypothetical protein
MEMNGEKPKVIRISRQPSPVHIIIDKKQPKNVEYLKYLGNMVTNDARRTREFKFRIEIQKQHSIINSPAIGLLLKEETYEGLRLEHDFVLWRNFDTSEGRSEIP